MFAKLLLLLGLGGADAATFESGPAVRSASVEGKAMAEIAVTGEMSEHTRHRLEQDLASGLSQKQLAELSDVSMGGGDCTNHATTATAPGAAFGLASHDVKCPANKLLGRWRVQQQDDEKLFVNFTCCQFGGDIPASTCEDKVTAHDLGAADTLTSLKKHELKCPTDKAITEWKFVKTDAKGLKFTYKCCGINAKWQFTECSDKYTPNTASGEGKLESLQYHNVKCAGGGLLRSWQLVQPDEKLARIKVKMECCKTGLNVALGSDKRRCYAHGDPHFRPFDYASSDRANMDKYQAGKWWLVKNKYVSVQMLYCRTYSATACSGSPSTSRDIAFGGPFLRGHKLVIAPAASSHTSHWDGTDISEMSSTPSNFKVDSMEVTLTRNGNKLTANLPLEIWWEGNTHNWGGNRGKYFSWSLDMKLLPGGQDGHCGNFNGNKADDNENGIKNRDPNNKDWKIDDGSSEDLLNKDKIGDPGTPGTIDDCAAEKKKQAEIDCTAQLGTPDCGGAATCAQQSFFDTCVFDVCFLGKIFAKLNAEDEKNFDETTKLYAPTPYKVYKNVGDKTKPCPAGSYGATIESETEKRAVEYALKDVPIGAGVILGAKFDNDTYTWNWFDGTATEPGCAFNDFIKPETDWRQPPKDFTHNNLCISISSGRWEACDLEKYDEFDAVCWEQKNYSIYSDVGPVKARTSCGNAYQLAMPKSSAEQRSLAAAVRGLAGTERVWLGARFTSGSGWMWDDGTPMCGFSNWASDMDETGAGIGSGDPNVEDFLCMDRATGKWMNCGPDKTQSFNTGCESRPAYRECPPGTLNGTDQGFVVDGKSTVSNLQGYCFYLAKGNQNCVEACREQIDSDCDLEGTQFISDNFLNCRIAMDSFGGFDYDVGKSGTQTVTTAGTQCVYDAKTGDMKVTVMKKDNSPYTTCEINPGNKDLHRICACT